jgi:1,4-dihydroxy-2-naphthoyl-CoA hydrolase
MSKIFSLPYIINMGDTDAAGIIYSPNLFRICLTCFERFLDETGISVASLFKQQKMGLPVVHLEGDFKRPNVIGDRVVIKLRMAEIGTSSFRVNYELLAEDGTCHATASIVHVSFNAQTRSSMEILPEIRAAFEKYL